MTRSAPLPDPTRPMVVPPRPPLPHTAARMPDDAARMPDDAARMPDDAARMPDDAARMPDDAPTEPIRWAAPTEPLRPAVPAEPVVSAAVTEPLPRPDAAPSAASRAGADADATTLPLPIITDTAAPPASGRVAPAPPSTPPAPRRARRHRGLRVLLGVGIPVVVLVALAAVGWFAGNTWARRAVVDQVAQQTRQALNLPAGHPVDVTVRDPVLPQLIDGTLDTLTVHVADAPVAGATADLTLHARGVPVRGDGTARSATAQVDLPAAGVTALAGDLGRTVPGSLRVVGGDVVVSLDPSQFLSGVSFALTLHPSVADGQLVLTPSAFDVGGMSMPADIVRARFGSLAPGILAPRHVCVASAFPRGLTLTSLTLGSDGAVAGFRVDPRTLADAALQRPGTCP